MCKVKNHVHMRERAFLYWNMLYTMKNVKEKKVLEVIPRVGNRLFFPIGILADKYNAK